MHPPVRRLLPLLAFVSFLVVTAYIYSASPSQSLFHPHAPAVHDGQTKEAHDGAQIHPPTLTPHPALHWISRPKYAYATFLGPPTVKAEAENATWTNNTSDVLQDPYFISARLLNFQIKRSESTKTRIKDAPFLVLVLPAVPTEQTRVLESEGATIVRIEPLDLPDAFDKEFVNHSRFRDVLSKLRLWQLTEFRKILYLDADSFLLQNLDSMFMDPRLSDMQETDFANATDWEKGDQDEENGGARRIPSEYLMAASADTYGDQTEWETPGHVNYLCACFMLFAPGMAMFNYYMSILTSPPSSNPLQNAAYPEQDLLIYAHRLDGPMPWRRIPIQWSANDGEMADELSLLGGVKSLHVKGWEGAEGGNVANEKWQGEWRKLIDEMELHYRVLRMHTTTED